MYYFYCHFCNVRSITFGKGLLYRKMWQNKCFYLSTCGFIQAPGRMKHLIYYLKEMSLYLHNIYIRFMHLGWDKWLNGLSAFLPTYCLTMHEQSLLDFSLNHICFISSLKHNKAVTENKQQSSFWLFSCRFLFLWFKDRVMLQIVCL